MVFNYAMTDAELIKSLGGPTKVAGLLRYEKNGVQRVQNWIKRGIPSHVKVQFPQHFMVKRKSPVTPRPVAPSAEATTTSAG